MELTPFEDGVKEMVADGTITQDEADELIAVAEQGEDFELPYGKEPWAEQEEKPEPEILIRHQAFNGMGPAMLKRLKEADIRYVEQLAELGKQGINDLPVSGIGPEKADSWYAQACKIMAKHSIDDN